MRRFLTLVSLVCLAVPAGVSISGCYRNPAGKFCNGLGYGLTDTQVASIILQPQVFGISLTYGETIQAQAPTAYTCKGTTAVVGSKSYVWGTYNNQLVDISPTGNICAGTWNRNTGGGILDYTYCYLPNPLPNTNGLPYAVGYIYATADSVSSNPVAVYVHAPVTSISLATPSTGTPTTNGVAACTSQGGVVQLDAQACYLNNGVQTALCAPDYINPVTGGNSCRFPSTTPDIIASGTYVSGGTISGSEGQTCNLANFNNGSTGATATVTLTGTNSIAGGTALSITAGGLNATAPPTSAQLSSGTATCSGTAQVSTVMTPIPTCESSIGTMNFTVGTASVASINSTTNQITAEQPGTTAITASIAQSGSSAGYFSTCPPASISVTLANGATSGTVAQGAPEGLTTTVLDTNGVTITGLSLSYQSTDPIDLSVGTTGSISTLYPGTAAINAICQPSSCNPAPINEIGLNGTGVSISSNPVSLTVPGTATDYAWFAAPGNSQYIVPVQLVTGAVGSSIRLPYVPNSMVMDKTGNSLYLGSPHELMSVSTSTNSIAKQDPTVPGVVLAVSPNNTQLLINDQARQLFYIYPVSGGTPITFGGMGAAAQWTPDGLTLYVYDNSHLNTPASCGAVANPITGHTDTLYVYNANTGWTVEALPPSPPLPSGGETPCNAAPNTTMPIMAQIPAIMIPGVGSYLSGDPTVAHTWCPSGTVGNNASVQFYPQGDSQAVQSDIVNTTIDGAHILGATANGGGTITLNDILDPIPPGATQSNGTTTIPTPQECSVTTNSATGVQTMNPLLINDGGAKSNFTQNSITSVDASSVNQVVTGSIPQASGAKTVGANIAFVTYSPASASSSSNALLPYYIPGTDSSPGSVNYVTLTPCSGCANVTAPLAGAFTPDHTLFFVSTAGDNEIHYISVTPSVNATTPPKDTQQISPNLTSCSPPPPLGTGNDLGCTYTGSGAIVPATVIEVKPRPVT